MFVDGLALLLFVLLVWLGWRAGALSQGLRVGAAVGAFILAPLVAELVREVLFGADSVGGPAQEVAALVAAGIGLYVLIALLGWLLIKAAHTVSDTLKTTDRLMGAGLGALKAIILIYFGLACLALLQVPLERVDPQDHLHLRDGLSFQIASKDPLIAPWNFPHLRRLHAALRVGAQVEERELHGWLREEHPKAADLLRLEHLQALLKDASLVDAARHDLYPRTLASGPVRRLLADPALRGQLVEVDWEAIEASLPPPAAP